MPNRGDEDGRLTFEGVGRVITAWEHVEFALGRLYSMFKGAPDTGVMHEYGEPRIFHDRMVRLSRAADSYFIRHPSQKYEDLFRIATKDAELISKRRNDIAHSVVFDISTLPFLAREWPSHRSLQRHNLPLFQLTTPSGIIMRTSRAGLTRRRSYRALLSSAISSPMN
jgi:hypothetical protein